MSRVQPSNGPNTYHSVIQMMMPTFMAPQLRTAKGLDSVPANREIGPPHEATNRIRSVKNPALRMKMMSMIGPITNPNPPEAIRDPTP